MKCVSIMGVAKALEAVFAISEVERDEDKDFSFSRWEGFCFIFFCAYLECYDGVLIGGLECEKRRADHCM